MKLGGSIFTHNTDRFDYCFEESIESLLALCDEVVVLDAESTDSTVPKLREMCDKNPKLKLVEGAAWNVGTNYDRLAILANSAKNHLTTPWHFMLQADEVLHERCIPIIRDIVNNDGYGYESFAVRRWNFFADFNHYVSLHSNKKPCNDAPIRLARTHHPAIGDAESIHAFKCNYSYVPHIEIFHYGLVRKSQALIEKSIDMQSWFHGQGSQPDYRIVAMKNEGTYDPFRLIDQKELSRFEGTHPMFARDWILEREKEHNYIG
jgi:glycosyltransferase involved in cell wall biosynthesis